MKFVAETANGTKKLSQNSLNVVKALNEKHLKLVQHQTEL